MARPQGRRINDRPAKAAEGRSRRDLQRRDFARAMENNKIKLGLRKCFTNAGSKPPTNLRVTAKVVCQTAGVFLLQAGKIDS